MKKFVIISVLLLHITLLWGQRRITPVNTPATITQSINETKRDSLDRSRLVKMEDANGNVVLVDTVSGKEFVDSTEIAANVPKMIYPLIHSVTVGVDLWAPVMRLMGASYGTIGFSGQLNMHNRYIPTLEIGLGNADYNPENNNYRYKSPMAPYFKIGADYNFLYNSNPDYLFYAGLRFGFSTFKYSVTDVTISPGYWQPEHTMSIPQQNGNATYFEFLLGLRVMIVKNISLGWSVRLHNVMHCSDGKYGSPYYIPGMGTRTSKIGGSFSVFYTLPLKKKILPEVDDTLPQEKLPEKNDSVLRIKLPENPPTILPDEVPPAQEENLIVTPIHQG